MSQRRRLTFERVWTILATCALVAVGPVTLAVAADGPFATVTTTGAARTIAFEDDPSTGHWFLTVRETHQSALGRLLGHDASTASSDNSVRGPLDTEMASAMSAAWDAAGAHHAGGSGHHQLVVDGTPLIDDLADGDVITAFETAGAPNGARPALRTGDPMAFVGWMWAVEQCGSCAGDLSLDIERDGRPMTVPVSSRDRQVAAVIAGRSAPYDLLRIKVEARTPETIVSVDASISGPSAGLAFALAYLDREVPGALTGPWKVAATGEIDHMGHVSAVGHVPEKLAGAAATDIDVVFIPAANLKDVGSGPQPEQVIPVEDLSDAIRWLCAHGADRQACAATTSGAEATRSQ